MTGGQLIKLLKGYEDFELDFCFVDGATNGFLNVRVFDDIKVGDIGHSDKVFRLTGEERY